jgi:mRNA interferase MazF
MHPIHLAEIDTSRPVLVLTREAVRPFMARVSVAPITSTIRGLSTEVPVGKANGLDHDGVVSCDNILTVPATSIRRRLGHLLPEQESLLAAAVSTAFELEYGLIGAH